MYARAVRPVFGLAVVAMLVTACSSDVPVEPRHGLLAQFVAPSNDNFADATVITASPFSSTVDITDATVEPGEPTSSCSAFASGKTIWYTFTPAVTGVLSATANAGFYTMVAAYTGSSLGDL